MLCRLYVLTYTISQLSRNASHKLTNPGSDTSMNIFTDTMNSLTYSSSPLLSQLCMIETWIDEV